MNWLKELIGIPPKAWSQPALKLARTLLYDDGWVLFETNWATTLKHPGFDLVVSAIDARPERGVTVNDQNVFERHEHEALYQHVLTRAKRLRAAEAERVRRIQAGKKGEILDRLDALPI